MDNLNVLERLFCGSKSTTNTFWFFKVSIVDKLKITLTVGVARTLAELGKRVLLFDIEPQGNLTGVFRNNQNKEKESLIKYWFIPDSLQNNKLETFKNSIEQANYKNINIIPAYKTLIKKTLQVLNSETASNFILKNNLKEIKNYLKDKYDYIFWYKSYKYFNNRKCFLSVDEIIVTIVPHNIEIFLNDYKNYLEKWKRIGVNLSNNMNSIVLNNLRKNKTHNFIKEQVLNSEFSTIILNTIIPTSLNLEKHTMLSNLTLTDKSPFFLLTKELLQKEIL